WQLPHPDTVRRLAEGLALGREDHAALAESAITGVRGGLRAAPDQPRHSGQRQPGLPVPATQFIGRERDINSVRQILEWHNVGLVALVGTAGAGKTRLAIATAATCAQAFADGVVFVDLGPVADPSFVPAAIAQAFGVHELRGKSLRETLHEYVE